MRVTVEALGLVPGGVGGIETYVRNLLPHLVRLGGPHEFLVIVGCEARGLITSGEPSVREWVVDASMPTALRRFRFVRSVSQWIRVTRSHAQSPPDVYHCTMSFPRPAWGARNMVITIHDLVAEHHPELLKPQDALLMRFFYRFGCRRASKVITISEYYKRTIVNRFGVENDRVDVIHLGVDRNVFKPERGNDEASRIGKEYNLRRPYLLYPAHTWPHKNHLRLLAAMTHLLAEHRIDADLVLAGSQKHGHAAVLRDIERLGLSERVHWIGHVDHLRLAALYRCAAAMIFPSLFEGFGMPIIEAMACGCPVVCSSIDTADDITGDAAETFDPLDSHDISEAIARVLRDDGLRQSLIDRGMRHAAQFSWERTARQTLSVYEQVASEQGRM